MTEYNRTPVTDRLHAHWEAVLDTPEGERVVGVWSEQHFKDPGTIRDLAFKHFPEARLRVTRFVATTSWDDQSDTAGVITLTRNEAGAVDIHAVHGDGRDYGYSTFSDIEDVLAAVEHRIHRVL